MGPAHSLASFNKASKRFISTVTTKVTNRKFANALLARPDNGSIATKSSFKVKLEKFRKILEFRLVLGHLATSLEFCILTHHVRRLAEVGWGWSWGELEERRTLIRGSENNNQCLHLSTSRPAKDRTRCCNSVDNTKVLFSRMLWQQIWISAGLRRISRKFHEP